VPAGFAHGFLALGDGVEVLYKMTDFWAPEHERVIIWDDAKLGIRWPLAGEPILSPRDAKGAKFAEAELFP
jgi:dTDP-4-dehydrorhamnose 3,5-epimerase